MDNDYVDVRGFWPMYVRGQVGLTLTGKPRTISVEDARVIAQKMLDEGAKPQPMNQ